MHRHKVAGRSQPPGACKEEEQQLCEKEHVNVPPGGRGWRRIATSQFADGSKVGEDNFSPRSSGRLVRCTNLRLQEAVAD